MIEEAKKKAEEIIENARREAEEIIREAEELWKKKAEEERAKIINKAKEEANVVLAEARRKARMIVAEAKYSIITSIIEDSWKKIENITKDKEIIQKSLKNLLKETIKFIPKETKFKIVVNPRDRVIVEEIVNELDISDRALIEEDKTIHGGLKIILEDGTIIDNTYETRLKRLKEAFIKEIATIIWGQ